MAAQPLTRREVLKKAAYITPVVLTLPAVPAFASTGSQGPKRRKGGNHWGWEKPHEDEGNHFGWEKQGNK